MLLPFTKINYCLSKLHFRPHLLSQIVLSSSFTNFLQETLSKKSSEQENESKKENLTKPLAEPLDYNELEQTKPPSQTVDMIFRQKRKTKKTFRSDDLPKNIYFQV